MLLPSNWSRPRVMQVPSAALHDERVQSETDERRETGLGIKEPFSKLEVLTFGKVPNGSLGG